jgi:hypothetical protein
LSGEDGAEVDFFLAQTDAATTRDYDGLIVQRIVEPHLHRTAGHENRINP